MRNWSAILVDAGIRGLSRIQLARELGIAPGQVSNALRRYGLKLRHDTRFGGQKPKGKNKNAHAVRARKEKKWRSIFETYSGASMNTICLKSGCSQNTVSLWAKRLGYSLPPSDKLIAAIERRLSETDAYHGAKENK